MTIQVHSEQFWTLHDYEALPEDGRRHEIIEGVLYVSPSPLTTHQLISRRLQFFFYQFELESTGFIYNAPVGLLIPGGSPVEPDLIFLRRDQRHLIQEKYIEGAPHLVAEILSPSTYAHDRVRKMNLYARNQIPFYLIVDPTEHTFEVFVYTGQNYALHASLTVGDEWTFEGKTLSLTELFAPLPE